MQKVKNNLKKATNISLSASVALASLPSSVFAGDASSILNSAMTNITKPGSYTETDSQGNQISSNFYSGGVSVSFDNSMPPPVFAVSPPSIEAGCNGINIKGMFVSLLGLDQLGAMLQNAGASLAWGVAIGLIYSLPGVASAFKMINQWAKDLQKLLGNACQSGIAIGQYLAKQGGLDKKEAEKTIMNNIPDWAKCGQEGENCVADALGLGDYFDKDGTFSFGGDNNTLTDKDKKDAINKVLRGLYESDYSLGGKLIQKTLEANGVDVVRQFVQQLFGAVSTSNKASRNIDFALTFGSGISDIYSLPLTKGVGTESFSNGVSLTQQRKNDLALFGYILIYNYIGDISLGDMNSLIATALSSYTGDASKKEQALKELESLKSRFPKVSLGGKGGAIPENEAGEKLANFILYGNSQGDVTTLESPIFTMIIQEEEKSADLSYTVIFNNASLNPTLDVSSFYGVKRSSKCKIYQMAGMQETPDCVGHDLSVPSLIPNIDRFVKIIKNSPSNKKYDLIDSLVEYNTQLVAQATLNAMYQNMDIMSGFNKKMKNISGSDLKNSNAKGATPDYVKNAILAQEGYLKRMSNILSDAKEKIKADAGDITNMQTIVDIFRKQEIENRERGMRSTVN